MGASPQSIQLLHVDDEPDLAEMAAEFLTRADDRISVDVVTSASEGLDQLGENGYDCVVSDYDMPGKSGIGFFEAVREGHADLPFILYTGRGSEDVASDAISSGVSDYLQKESGTSQYEVLANRIKNVDEFGEDAQRILDNMDEVDGLTLYYQVDQLRKMVDQRIYKSFEEGDPNLFYD